jgi:indolepyruvate ferredoxin oxidoreductase
MGGTGVVTIGALIGMAAHLEGKGCGVLDMTGLAQKGGSVWTHLKVASSQDAIRAIRVAPGEADLVLGCDLVVAASTKTRSQLRPGASRVVLNTHAVMPGEFTRKPDLAFPGERMRALLESAVGEPNVHAVDAGGIVQGLFGDSIAVNVFMLGYAWQKGLLPIGIQSLEQAIELNGTAVKQNKAALLWGRRTAHDLGAVMRLLAVAVAKLQTLDELIQHRMSFLADYQDTDYAKGYGALVAKVRAAEHTCAAGRTRLTEAVARSYFKLLAYKDEYEIARLYSAPDFARKLAGQFDGKYRIAFNLAPPLLARRDPQTGVPRKMSFGPWMLSVFLLLARARRLRGTLFDPFGWTRERRLERQLIAEYESLILEILKGLEPYRYETAVQLASLPQTIRGFGHVKAKSIAEAKAQELQLREQWHTARPLEHAAA